ncbi:MAG: ribonuclease P protein subunit [Nanobdellota archaeon]
MVNLRKVGLIGLWAKVEQSTNSLQEGLEGMLVDETKNTFIIKHKKKSMLIKNQVILLVQADFGLLRIDGKKFMKKPEERIKER